MATTVDSFHTGASVLSIVRVLNFSLPSLPCLTVTNGSLLPEKRVETELGNHLDFFCFWLSLYKQFWTKSLSPPRSMGSSGPHLTPPSSVNSSWTKYHSPSALPAQWTALGPHLTPSPSINCSRTKPHLPYLARFSQLPPIYVFSSFYYNAERFHQKGASLILLVHILFLLFIS